MISSVPFSRCALITIEQTKGDLAHSGTWDDLSSCPRLRWANCHIGMRYGGIEEKSHGLRKLLKQMAQLVPSRPRLLAVI